MKYINILLLSLSFIILGLTSCKTLKEINIDASNGKISYTYVNKKGQLFPEDTVIRKKQQYFKRDQKVTINVKNLSPQLDVEILRNENDIWISGDSLISPTQQHIESFHNTDTTSVETIKDQLSALIKDQSVLKSKLDNIPSSTKNRSKLELKDNYNRQLEEINESISKKLNELNLERQKLMRYNNLIEFYNELVDYNNLKTQEFDYLTESNKENFMESLTESNTFKSRIPEFSEFKDSAIYSKCNATVLTLDLLKVKAANFRFNTSHEFTPSKEKTELTIKIKEKNKTKPFSTSNLIIYQQSRFKMYSSIGTHLLISDSKYAYQYSNRDSIIVSKKTSNLLPSIGTYLNATWSYNRAVFGFGLGIGIPINIDKSTDYTPNIVTYGTVAFQTEYGRMGFILGMGIRKVNILAPGYSNGGKMPDASIDPPLTQKWVPGLMFGLTYNLGKRK